MGQAYFEFRQFRVWHDRCAMKIGTDAVLLGAWCDVEQATSVLDVGTGSGVIALMAAQRSPAEIVGIDIDPEAVEQARRNMEESPWRARMAVVQGDICASDHPLAGRRFSFIVSNPPFYEHALDAADERRNNARNESSLPFPALIDAAVSLLETDGRLNVILPYAASEHFIYRCWENSLRLYRRTDVYTKGGKGAVRSLLGFSFRKCVRPQVDKLVIHEPGGTFSKDFAALVRDYYTSM